MYDQLVKQWGRTKLGRHVSWSLLNLTHRHFIYRYECLYPLNHSTFCHYQNISICLCFTCQYLLVNFYNVKFLFLGQCLFFFFFFNVCWEKDTCFSPPAPHPTMKQLCLVCWDDFGLRPCVFLFLSIWKILFVIEVLEHGAKERPAKMRQQRWKETIHAMPAFQVLVWTG